MGQQVGAPFARDPVTAAASITLGVALAIGLGGAFVGLSTSSYWFDELFTKWVIGADSGSLFLARAMSDAHPPTYYALAYAWSFIVGNSDGATRLLSAICAVSAVGIFVWRMPASLNARLFAGALATSSIFWFYQSQNARSYALGLLLLTIVLVGCLGDLTEERRPSFRRLLVEAALLELAAMTHLYMFFACLAAVAMMFVLRRQNRLRYCGLGAFLFATAGAYYLLVIPGYSQFNVGKTWIPGNASWVLSQSIDAVKQSYGVFGVLALALCGVALVASGARRPMSGRRLEAAVFCVGVAVLTLMAAIASSIVTPTFTTRNFLVVSPFLWGLTACIYDLSFAPTGSRQNPILTGAIAVLTALSATIVLQRTSAHNEPFEESARWIREQSECRGADIPVISVGDPDPGDRPYRRTIEASSYAHYLGTFARPVPVFSAELDAAEVPAVLGTELAERARGQGCPVLAVVSHGASDQNASQLATAISKLTGAEPGAIKTHTERVSIVGIHSYAILDRLFAADSADTLSSFVFYAQPAAPAKARLSAQLARGGSRSSTRTSGDPHR